MFLGHVPIKLLLISEIIGVPMKKKIYKRNRFKIMNLMLYIAFACLLGATKLLISLEQVEKLSPLHSTILTVSSILEYIAGKCICCNSYCRLICTCIYLTFLFYFPSFFTDSKSTYSYKLASITALHIALKVHNRTTIKATTLEDLSKGEISATDIIHMETMMLKALDYHLCPPTCQTFIVLFAELLPVSVRESSVVSHIIQQAMYIAELSPMHLLMKGVKASVLSVGAMMNVMDTMVGENSLRRDDCVEFLKRLRAAFNIDQSSNVLVPGDDSCYWWKEVKLCRFLLDEIVALNCRQAMDGSDQILPCNNLYFYTNPNHQNDCYNMNENKFGIQEGYQHIISSSESTESSSLNSTDERQDDQQENPREIC